MVDGAETPIPPFLVESLREAYPDDVAERIVGGYADACSRPVTLRANGLKASTEEVAAALDAHAIAFERVPWYADAFVLGAGVTERDVWELDIYAEGKVYLQSLSSMLPPLVLGPRPRTDVLDMCAAPGGKTSQLAALEPAAHITACELSAPRADKLEYNLGKLGARNVQVMRTTPASSTSSSPSTASCSTPPAPEREPCARAMHGRKSASPRSCSRR